MAWPDYELVDFGEGRKLERFGAVLLDRPSPAAERAARRMPERWPGAIRYERESATRGYWLGEEQAPADWSVAFDRLRFDLKLTPFGHVGLFPEQANNWSWLARVAASDGQPLKALNLFAYTGASTLAAAAASAQVTHVDAAANVVAWARRNAALSGLVDAPIRWITEDAMTFVGRELKRGNTYDAVILDPPSYGHGPHGEIWRLEDDLERLLTLCAELTRGQPRFMLLTCHSPTVDARQAAQLLREALSGGVATGHDLEHKATASDPAGRKLHSGVAARWTAK